METCEREKIEQAWYTLSGNRENNARELYPLSETLKVFDKFFQEYESSQREPHPHIAYVRYLDYLPLLPYFNESRKGRVWDIRPEEYYSPGGIIERYFKTAFRADTNYRAYFFLRGPIRQHRYTEMMKVRMKK